MAKVSFPEVKRPDRKFNPPPHFCLIPRLKERVELYFYFFLGLHVGLQSEIHLPLHTYFMEVLAFVTNTFVSYVYSLCDLYINIIGQYVKKARYNKGINLNLSLNCWVKCNFIITLLQCVETYIYNY